MLELSALGMERVTRATRAEGTDVGLLSSMVPLIVLIQFPQFVE